MQLSRTPPITIVGCGPGSPDYVTPAARKAIRQAGVLAGAERLLAQYAPRGKERIAVGKDIAGVLDRIARHLARHRRIAVLVTGDAGVFSLAQPVLKRFGRARCRVIPGVSSVQVAFARLGLDWSDARILSAHGCEPRAQPAALARFSKIAILTGGRPPMAWLDRCLSHSGRDYGIWVCEDLTLKTERVRSVSRKTLARIRLSSRTIILLIKNSQFANP